MADQSNPPRGNTWGSGISGEREAEFEQRLHAWERTAGHDESKGPFEGFKLTGADVFWLAARALAGTNEPQALATARDQLWRAHEQHAVRATLHLGALHLEGALLDSVYLGRIVLRGAHLERAHLEGAVLVGAQLEGVHLEDAHLRTAQLKDAWLKLAHLERAHLDSVDLDEAWLKLAHLEGADLHGATLQRAQLNEAHLEGADLEMADLKRAHLQRAHLEDAQLTGAHLEGADLSEAYLDGALAVKYVHLEGANLREAHLQGTTLDSSYLEGVNLGGAHLERAHLCSSHLEGAWLYEAHLEGADLCEAHLEGACLEGAHLEGADLSGVHLEGRVYQLGERDDDRVQQWSPRFLHTLAPADLRGAFLDSATRLDDVTLGRPGEELGQGYVRVADLHWNGVNLAVIREWPEDMVLGDEREAYAWQPPEPETADMSQEQEGQPRTAQAEQERLELFRAALRANRQLAMALRAQGMDEEADVFAHRAQLLKQGGVLR